MSLAIPGVTGVDFGIRFTQGRPTGTDGIRFHVSVKRSLSDVPAGERVPTKILGIETDVLQARYSLHAASDPFGSFDPIVPGVSVGNLARGETGTLGAVVRDLNDGTPCLLSNWHVFCAAADVKSGEEIAQPGPESSDAPPKVVAKLKRWTNLAHGLDAAIAQLDAGLHWDNAPLFGPAAMAGTADPQLRMHLVKSGISSRFTHAIVDGVDGSYKMDYSDFGDTSRFMDGIHLITDPDHPDEDISLEGDSRSMWIDPVTNRAVALHFGGEDGAGPTANYALAHPMSVVLTALSISLP